MINKLNKIFNNFIIKVLFVVILITCTLVRFINYKTVSQHYENYIIRIFNKKVTIQNSAHGINYLDKHDLIFVESGNQPNDSDLCQKLEMIQLTINLLLHYFSNQFHVQITVLEKLNLINSYQLVQKRKTFERRVYFIPQNLINDNYLNGIREELTLKISLKRISDTDDILNNEGY